MFPPHMRLRDGIDRVVGVLLDVVPRAAWASPAARQQDVDDLAVLVDGPGIRGAARRDLHGGFVDESAVTQRVPGGRLLRPDLGRDAPVRPCQDAVLVSRR